MVYTKQNWNDGAAGGTPINATRLNHLEDGVLEAHAALLNSRELGYASRDASFVTTVDALMPLLSVGTRGKGRLVDLEFYCSNVAHSVSGTWIQAVLLNQLGVQLEGGGELVSNVTFGRRLYVKTRLLLNDGVDYVFSVNTTRTAAGTSTWFASPQRPIWLAVTEV